MLKDKKALELYLEKQCDRIVVDNDKCKSIYNYANETYEIPKGIVSDLISKRMAMSNTSEFVLFILLDSLNHVLRESMNDILGVDNFYTMQEAKYYRTSKYEVEKIKFPLVFKMVQVDNDQWIGKINVSTLMKLRQAQLINYNVNTQRVLQKIVKGDKETYKISLNQKSVSEIRKSFEEGNFISNVITLNIPLDSESDFYYDSDSSSLIIKSLESFHILDGYHRFVAIGQIWDLNNNFEYQMELRLTHWDETKAKTFIWQDNKKTFMKKVDRESFNLNNEANIIVERLNNNVFCNMKGLINRNHSIINFGEMAMFVDWFYIKNNQKKGSSNAAQLEITKELIENINILTESNTKYLEEQWNYLLLLSAMCVFNYCKNNNFDKRNMASLVDNVYKELSNSNDTKLKNHTPRKALIEYVNEVIKKLI